MLLKTIDKLLDRVFQKEPDTQRLNHLERDVWARIRESERAIPAFSLPWLDLSNSQLRYASLVLALVSGLAFSQATFQPSAQSDRLSDALGLEIFSPYSSKVPFLITLTHEESAFSIL